MSGLRKVNRTGRDSSQLVRRSRHKINEQFVPRVRSMLESVAFRVLSLSALKILHRLEVEHMAHAGTENGNLIVTHADLVHYGVSKNSIAAAIRELAALGFIAVAVEGRGGNGDFHSPNKYRLTYLRATTAEATNDWRKHTDLIEAERVADAARRDKKSVSAKTKRRPHKKGHTAHKKWGGEAALPPPENGTAPPPLNVAPIYILGEHAAKPLASPTRRAARSAP